MLSAIFSAVSGLRLMSSNAATIRARLLLTLWRISESFWLRWLICSTERVTGSAGRPMRVILGWDEARNQVELPAVWHVGKSVRQPIRKSFAGLVELLWSEPPPQ